MRINIGWTFPIFWKYRRWCIKWYCKATGKPFYDPIILTTIRRVMPNIIAQQIVGVQPMIPPKELFDNMKARYGIDNDEDKS